MTPRNLRFLSFIALLLQCLTVSAAQLRVKIDGVSRELADAARSSLSLQQYANRDATPAQLRRQFTAGYEEIARALEPYGYYNVKVTGDLQQTGQQYQATYHIVLGDPVRVRQSSVKVTGEAMELPSVQNALRHFRPANDDRFDHGVYEKSKNEISTALADNGFGRNRETLHRVEVSRKSNTADIELAWQSGPRLQFGAVRFSGAPFPQEFLDRYIPWKSDDWYSPDELLALQQRLIDADYFSTVTVQPQLADESSTEVPVDVQLVPAKRTVYTAGIYMSTDTGPGARVGMARRWLNRRGHKLNISVDQAQRLQAIAAGYTIPLLGRDERSFNFGVTYRDENTITSVSRTERATANETRQWHGFTRTLGLQFVAGDFEIADEKRYSTLTYAEATLSKKKADNLFFPRRGYSLAVGIRLAPQGLLSDTSLLQATLDTKWILPAGERQRVLLRSSLGAMAVRNFDELTPELRFFAGGDRSVRGFDYQELGSTNARGQVIGGTYLAAASVEFEHYFLPKWGAAAFVDAGDAFRGSQFNLNAGAGIGVRWRSPVGILRVDIAKPVISDLANNFRFHIAIGPDL